MENTKYIVKVASYKNSKSLFAKFIRFQQRYLQGLPNEHARFSHSEIVFVQNEDPDIFKKIKQIESFDKNNGGRETILKDEILLEKFKNNNLWFSSSEIDGGTRFKFIQDNKNNWVHNCFEVSKEQYLDMLDYCISEDNNSYGWLSIIFTQGLKTLWFIDRKSPFCSQITVQVLQKAGYLCGFDSIQINPGKLSYILENRTLNEKPNFIVLFLLFLIIILLIIF